MRNPLITNKTPFSAGARNSVWFVHLSGLLRGRAAELEGFLLSTNPDLKGLVEENHGLLGSTEKRIAEINFEVERKQAGGD